MSALFAVLMLGGVVFGFFWWIYRSWKLRNAYWNAKKPGQPVPPIVCPRCNQSITLQPLPCENCGSQRTRVEKQLNEDSPVVQTCPDCGDKRPFEALCPNDGTNLKGKVLTAFDRRVIKADQTTPRPQGR